jgi:hypothetical protein
MLPWNVAARLLLGIFAAGHFSSYFCAAFLIAGEPRTNRESVGRYAPVDAFAAVFVRPKQFIEHEHIASLPIYWWAPDPISPRRLERLGVEDFAVFAMSASDEAVSAGRSEVEFAAAARLKAPISLVELMRGWRESMAPGELTEPSEPIPRKIEGVDCFVVTAGSFFPAPRVYGGLRFTDRLGIARETGINVGNLNEDRSFIEGESESSIIVTFEGLSEQDLFNGHLPLGIHSQTFYTHQSEIEYLPATVTLRNPETQLECEPISFGARSFAHQRIDIPRRLKVKTKERARDADLLKDFVANGKLEVVIKAHEDAQYLGVSEKSVYLRRRAWEYVLVSGNEIVIAQSEQALAQMLRAAAPPRRSPDLLGETAGDLVLAVDLKTEVQKAAWKKLMAAIRYVEITELWQSDLEKIEGAIDIKAESAKFTATFKTVTIANMIRKKFPMVMSRARKLVRLALEEQISQSDVMTYFVSLAFRGVPAQLAFPSSAEGKARTPQISEVLESAIGRFTVKHVDRSLTFELAKQESPVQLSPAAKLAAATLERVHASALMEWERFDLGDEMHERATQRFPNAPEVWICRGHDLAFNQPARMNGHADRYRWIRRGIFVLLEGAERNPEHLEILWMAARTIGWKLGTFGPSAAFREMFSKDKELQERLAKLVDLKRARSPQYEVDSWIVSRLLFEYCRQQYAKNPSATKMPPMLILMQPGIALAEYGRVLGEAGHEAESRAAWKLAAEEFAAVEKIPFLIDGGAKVRLDELERRRAESGAKDFAVKELEFARLQGEVDYWQARCRIEPLPKMQLLQKMSQEGAKNALQRKSREALHSYRIALEALLELYKEHPKDMRLVAVDFYSTNTGYRRVADDMKVQPAPELAEVLELVKAASDAHNAFEGLWSEREKRRRGK